MSLTVPCGFVSVGIQQQANAGHQFDGSAPTGDITWANGINKYPAADAGGLFNFVQEEPIVITQYACDFGGDTAYKLTVESLDATGAVIAGESLTIDEGTATKVLSTAPVLLTKGQVLKLVTTTGAGAKLARVFAVQERNHQR